MNTSNIVYTCKAKVSVANSPTVSHTTAGSSAAPSLVDGAGSSSSASAVLPPNLTTILPLAGKALPVSGSTACIHCSVAKRCKEHMQEERKHAGCRKGVGQSSRTGRGEPEGAIENQKVLCVSVNNPAFLYLVFRTHTRS